MEKLKDFASKITGKDNKYTHNLLGESLADLLRRATAKTLQGPDEIANEQVVDSIQQEVASGKDTKEIVALLKKRLKTDNPQKQWLGVLLFEKVMNECSNVLGAHQEEMLREVAAVFAKPAKPESEAGKRARGAAKELLRKYGRAGTTAFQHARQEVYGGRHSAAAHGLPQGAMPYADHYGAPHVGAGAYDDGGAVAAITAERQSLSDEIQLLIDKAKSNTELLSDMLVNANANKDDFEMELINDLMGEVLELRGLFDAYLEQLQGQEGADMEVLMIQALEAVDMLDGCIALQRDVSSSQQLPATNSTSSTTAASSANPFGAAPGGSGSAAHPAAAAAPAADLISLDDLADSMANNRIGTPVQPTASASVDPFAASMSVPLASNASNPLSVPTQSGMYPQTSGAGVPPQYGLSPPTGGQFMGQQPPASAYGVPQYGSYPPASGMPLGSVYNPYQMQTTGYAPPQYPNTPGMGYGAAAYGMPPQQTGGAGGNPFGGAPPPQQQAAGGMRGSDGGFGMPMPPPGVLTGTSMAVGPTGAPPATGSAGGGNPFGAAPGGQQNLVDKEWNMFFADRAGPGAGPRPQNPAQINADFDNLVAQQAAAPQR